MILCIYGGDKLEIYQRIKQRRKELELSADDVADAIGVSRATVYRYESKDVENMPITILEPLSKVLKCSPGYLMGWEEIQDNITLSSIEKHVLMEYRKSDDMTKELVHRVLHIEGKNVTEKMA